MFTGIVQSVGTVRSFQRTATGARLVVETGLPATANLKIGDSVAVDGCCQTIVVLDGATCTFDCLEETLDRTNFGNYKAGQRVNIEPALAVGDRLGGHIVQGHVDSAQPVLAITRRAGDLALTVKRPSRGEFPAVEKGSIAINGVSLTIAELKEDSITVCLIPHTWEVTALSTLKVGVKVNLEADVLGKYIAELCGKTQPRVTLESLQNAGF